MKLEIELEGGLGLNANAFDKAEFNRMLADEMLETRNRIVADATERHADAEGGALRRYRAPYIRAIQEGRVFGYDGTKKTSTETDLKISGLFWRSLISRATANGAECYFVGTHPLGQTKSSAFGLESGDRSTGTGRFGLGGRLAEQSQKKHARRKNKGGSISNTQLAAELYARGFRGWFAFGKRDYARITARALTYLDGVIKNLVALK